MSRKRFNAPTAILLASQLLTSCVLMFPRHEIVYGGITATSSDCRVDELVATTKTHIKKLASNSPSHIRAFKTEMALDVAKAGEFPTNCNVTVPYKFNSIAGDDDGWRRSEMKFLFKEGLLCIWPNGHYSTASALNWDTFYGTEFPKMTTDANGRHLDRDDVYYLTPCFDANGIIQKHIDIPLEPRPARRLPSHD